MKENQKCTNGDYYYLKDLFIKAFEAHWVRVTTALTDTLGYEIVPAINYLIILC